MYTSGALTQAAASPSLLAAAHARMGATRSPSDSEVPSFPLVLLREGFSLLKHVSMVC